MVRLVLLTFAFFVSFTTLAQPFYRYERVRNVEVSSELVGVYNTVYNAFKEGGVDMTRIDNRLSGVYMVNDIDSISNKNRTLGVTLIGKKPEVILFNRDIDSYFMLVVTMYHEMTHFILNKLDCDQGLFLFQPTYSSNHNSQLNKLYFHKHVELLIRYIKSEQDAIRD
jgi:hypothetical protein